jgi:hypothetical protein
VTGINLNKGNFSEVYEIYEPGIYEQVENPRT